MNENFPAQKILSHYGGVAPRYTSYPSAAHFQKEFPSSEYERFLKDQPCGTEVSVYVHVPFCRALCHYCGCFTRITQNDDPIRKYADSLKKEIALAGKISGRSLRTSHIHFGGGSPNLLDVQDLKELIAAIDNSFPIKAGAEIAMECDPRHMTVDKTQDLASSGVNRVSLGVQDFSEKTQQAVNRTQPFSQIVDCTQWLREAGIDSINFDLIYGLPYQSAQSVAGNALKAAALRASRVALFGYAHVPWMKPHQKALEKYHLPGPQERYEQAQAARAIFMDQGYEAVGMDHFALPGDALTKAAKQGHLRRNFQGYTTDQAPVVLGFGISAIGRFPQGYVQNTSSFSRYRESLERDVLPAEKGMHLNDEDRLRADIIEKLMCFFTVDVGDVCDLHGFAREFADKSLQKLEGLHQEGLVELDGRVVTVTPEGRFFIRSVCACFDAYFQDSEKKYARAV